MKLKDIMPVTNKSNLSEEVQKKSKISEKITRKPQHESDSQEILNIYHQVVQSEIAKLKNDELDLLQNIIFRIENDSNYIPSSSVVNFARILFRGQ